MRPNGPEAGRYYDAGYEAGRNQAMLEIQQLDMPFPRRVEAVRDLAAQNFSDQWFIEGYVDGYRLVWEVEHR